MSRINKIVRDQVGVAKDRSYQIEKKQDNGGKAFKFPLPLQTEEQNSSNKSRRMINHQNNGERSSDNKEQKQNSNFKASTFVSPMYGRLKDKATYPQASTGKKTLKLYDFLRDERKLSEDELLDKYGTKYYEFSNVLQGHRNMLTKSSQSVKNNEPSQDTDKTFEETFAISTSKKEETEKRDLDIPFASFFENKSSYDNEELSNDQKEIINNKLEDCILEEEFVITTEDDQINSSFNEEDNIRSFYTENENGITVNYDSEDDFADVESNFDNDLDYDDDELISNDYDDNEFKYEEKFDFNSDDVQIETVVKPKKENRIVKKNKPTIIETPKQKPTKQVSVFNNNNSSDYEYPPIDLLNPSQLQEEDSFEWLEEKRMILDETFENFGVDAAVVNYTKGPTVTRFEIQPGPGIKVSKITSLQDNIKLSLAAIDIRMEAPIPGKNTIGIEIPNDRKKLVAMRDVIDDEDYIKDPSLLKVALGVDIAGNAIFTNINKMPHGLIAGTTGSGKSVCINAIITSILFNAKPDEVKLMLIDPKMVELAPYRNIPHLATPVINDVKTATAALKWATEEMDRRYETFAEIGARDIRTFNLKTQQLDGVYQKIPYIVIVIDELADLMTMAPQEVEDSILRLAQKARAAGIHLLLATQRPSVNIITGTIKTNIPTRIAFAVQSVIDSRTILDESGADKLLGLGDMLILESGMSQPTRVQGAYISDDEIESVANFVRGQSEPEYLFEQADLISNYDNEYDFEDPLFDEVTRFIINAGSASASAVQRRFRVGYNRAARLIDMLEYNEIIGPSQGSKPRNVLMTLDEYEDYFQS